MSEKDVLKGMSVEDLQAQAEAIRQDLDKAVQEFIELHDRGIAAFDPVMRELARRGVKVKSAIASYWSRAVKYTKLPGKYPQK